MKFALPFPLLCDTSRAVGMAYGACDSTADAEARRITFVIGPDGRIRETVSGMKGAEHPVSVLSSLE